ncbi:MAG TPA: murein biosynthesis integral membrane protein MurJ [Candidatus Limnocylindrales bacterium]|nr:murein biosynthesis integral membrane protein MurJ [Candidatus Limnocylindrales bacterium]
MSESAAETERRERAGTAAHAVLVATGILLSRVAGLVRQRVFAHYFGQSDPGDAFNAAFRIPNFLQNLFGEGVLSASFIPVYSKLLARGEEAEARRVAGAVATLLALVTSLLVLAGITFTPRLVDLIAPGFEGEKRELTLRMVRIIFPGTGLLVLSAWCLGILNSHRRFLLSYTAPVVWSAAMIAAMLYFGTYIRTPDLAVALAWASVAGAALQLLVQLPVVRRLVRGVRPSLGVGSPGTRTVVRTFGPVFVGRGVVQISAYVDSVIASFLPAGAVTALANAQTLYTLPVSLFGMSVSAAELPAMSRVIGDHDEVARLLRARLDAGLGRVAFFIVPSAMAFVALGRVIAAALFQTGRFGANDAVWVWGILAGSSIGLLASTLGRLYSSVYYALHDTGTPLRYAATRVLVGTTLGWFASLHLPGIVGVDPKWGVAFLTAASGTAGWVEFSLLRHTLNKRIGRTGLARERLLTLWGSAAVAALAGLLIERFALGLPPIVLAVAVLVPYGVTYLAITSAAGIGDATAMLARIRRMALRR